MGLVRSNVMVVIGLEEPMLPALLRDVFTNQISLVKWFLVSEYNKEIKSMLMAERKLRALLAAGNDSSIHADVIGSQSIFVLCLSAGLLGVQLITLLRINL